SPQSDRMPPVSTLESRNSRSGFFLLMQFFSSWAFRNSPKLKRLAPESPGREKLHEQEETATAVSRFQRANGRHPVGLGTGQGRVALVRGAHLPDGVSGVCA